MVEPAARVITDSTVANWLHEHASPSITEVMRAITVLGSPVFVIVIALAAIVLLLLRRELYEAVLLGVGVGGGMLVNTILKNVFDRARPHIEPALAQAYGYSFPSGHTAGATLLYGCIVLLAWRRLPTRPARIAVVSVCFLLVELISVSRIYLGVHYLTDVLAAQVLGVIWLVLSFTAVEVFRRRRLATLNSQSLAGPSR